MSDLRVNHAGVTRRVLLSFMGAGVVGLVGAGAATGLLRLDVLGGGDDGAVAVHTCDTGDTTAYVKYPGGEVLASHPSAECAAVGPLRTGGE